MKKHLLPPRKAAWLLTLAGGLLLSATAWATDYPGYVKVEHFDNVAGGNISDLTAAAKYINNQPDFVTFVDTLYYSRNPGADAYGARISGFLTPKETADYVFFVAADDSASFYLSTDASPANLKLVAADQGWQNAKTWTGPGGESSGAGTTAAIFRRGTNPGPAVMEQNGFKWVGPFENRSDEFLTSPRSNLAGANERWPTTNAQGNAVINLKANQKYYFQLLYKEGSGGENGGVAWKKAGDPDPANNDPEISGEFLSVTYTNVLTFMTQPKSQSVSVAQPVTFTVQVVGVPGDSDPATFTYSWLKNGQAIAGADNLPSYSIPSPALSDSGNKYSVKVTTAGGLTGTSAEATLTVSDDHVPPTIIRIASSDTFMSAKLTFSEAVRNEAADPANYKFSGGLTVTDVSFAVPFDPNNQDDAKNPTNPTNRLSVILFTSKQTEGASYDLTVSNVKDITGNALSPNTAKMYANVFKPGILNYKRWEGGNNIPNLIDDALRFANPTVSDTRTIAETGGQAATYVAGTYVDRVDGFFIPTVTTNYVFLMSADNDGYLYLSTDADPANRKMIAADVGWQNTRTWTGPGGDDTKRRGDLMGGGPFENRSDELLTSQRAINGTGLLAGLVPADGEDPEPWPTVDANGNAVISLKAGQRYAFQLWHVEGDSGRAEATVKYAGAPDPAIGTQSVITNTFIGAYIDPTGLPPVITNQPANVNFNPGETINFSVGVDSALPPNYQWYKDQAAIAGQTNRTLTIANATVAAAGSYYVTATTVNGSATSSTAAALTAVPAPHKSFQQDASGMTVMEAENYYDSTKAPDGHLWVPASGRAGFSGAGYMTILPDSGINAGNDLAFTNTSARLDYKVKFTTGGTNYLWLRGGDPRGDGAGDSFHAGIDGTPSAIRLDGTPSFNIATGWNWVGNIQGDTRAFVVVPGAGEHTINLWMREDGFSVDKLVLTTSADYTPEGTGPSESQSSGGGGGEPTISVARNASGAPVITYTGTLQSSAVVTGPYTAVSGASGGSYTPNTQQAAHQFYRSSQ